MKNYFNKENQANHLLTMAALLGIQNLIKSDAPTAQEIAILKRAEKAIKEFTQSVVNRLGESYRRQLNNKLTLNTFRLVPRCITQKKEDQIADTVDSAVLIEMITLAEPFYCANCTKTDCTECKIYGIKTFLNYDGIVDDTDLCPFRTEEKEFNFIF